VYQISGQRGKTSLCSSSFTSSCFVSVIENFPRRADKNSPTRIACGLLFEERSGRFQQSDAFGAMRTEDFLPGGVNRKLDMPAAQHAGHFHQFTGALQRHHRFAMRAGDLLAQVLNGKFDVSATSGAKGFREPSHICGSALHPKHDASTGEQEDGNQACDGVGHMGRKTERDNHKTRSLMPARVPKPDAEDQKIRRQPRRQPEP
jgi:hypothetical protein